MNRQYPTLELCLSVLLLLAASGCGRSATSNPPTPPAPSPDAQIRATTQRIAEEAVGLTLGKVLAADHRDNFSGLRTDNITFSQRLDSRTFFAYDNRFSDTKSTGMFTGPDEAIEKRGREVLERLRIPAAEIASVKVVQERTQLGERDSRTGKVKLEPAQAGKKWARATREIEGLPVFSSRATIGLMPDGAVGFLEVHWPEIPAQTIETARRYREIAGRSWKAPEVRGARVESVTAGILHSPAAGTAMDIVPVIRVVYAPLDKRLGKKPVAYVDGDGKPVTMPRVLLAPPREELKTTRGAPSAVSK